MSPISFTCFSVAVFLLPCLSVLFFDHVLSQCQTRPFIFNFGDSNSDTGGLAAGLGFTIKPPNGRSLFLKPAGRLCDGLLVIDFLCQSLNTSLLSPYMESLGSNFSNGANFAVIGSSTLPKYLPFALNIQIMQFLHFKERSLQLSDSGCNGMMTEEAFGNALYMIDIGQNDIADAFSKNLSYEQVVQKIPDIVLEIRNAVQAIYKNGGRKIWIHNTGPLGCLPQKLSQIGMHHGYVDSIGCILSYNKASQIFNEELKHLCHAMGFDLKNATIIYVDIYAIKYDLITNSTAYGFSKSLAACCGFGGPPYNYNVNVTCGNPGYQVCDKTSKFVSWDGTHYTEAANIHIARSILSTTYSVPQTPFNFFCT